MRQKATEKTTFRVETGIPCPPARGPKNHYPFMDMPPGSSFFVPCPDDRRGAVASRISSSAGAFVRREGGKLKFATRRVEGGVRCWRVA